MTRKQFDEFLAGIDELHATHLHEFITDLLEVCNYTREMICLSDSTVDCGCDGCILYNKKEILIKTL